MAWTEHSRFALGLFAMLAPFDLMPVFIGLTARMTLRGRLATATIACLTLFLTLTLVLYLGEVLLAALGTSLSSFQIAGGAIIALNGMAIMKGAEPGPARDGTAKEAGPSVFQVGVVPLGIPLLAGPGAMTQMMLEGHGSSLAHEIVLIAIIAGCTLATWGILLAAIPISRFLGRTGLRVLEQVFGVILVAIGVEFVVRGVLAHAAGYLEAAGSAA